MDTILANHESTTHVFSNGTAVIICVAKAVVPLSLKAPICLLTIMFQSKGEIREIPHNLIVRDCLRCETF